MLRLMMTKIILIIEHVSGVDYDDTVTKKGFHERNKTKNITFTKKESCHNNKLCVREDGIKTQ